MGDVEKKVQGSQAGMCAMIRPERIGDDRVTRFRRV